MLWKVQYSDYRVEAQLGNNKDDALDKAKQTLNVYPYLRADLFKFRGDEKIYVATYEMNKSGALNLVNKKR